MDISGIDYLGLDRVLKRGTGEVIEEHELAMFVYDSVSEAYFLACADPALGAEILERHRDRDYHALMVSDHGLGLKAYERYGFEALLECYQGAYYGGIPEIPETGLVIREAEEKDLPFLNATYEYTTPEEMRQLVEHGRVLLGFEDGQPVGLIGEHLEGSMGLLHILPQYRRKGYAEALEKAMIAKTLGEGLIPFGQVQKDNQASLGLQSKLGMTMSKNLICWMWR
ncbi:MAG: GNAT family N-acetyltransferase [Lachnospiraceae bacterium]|nr:GNAT family N-acetyltransferase [Lachnospiraceae bacterium]